MIQQSSLAYDALCDIMYSYVARHLSQRETAHILELHKTGAFSSVSDKIFEVFDNKPLERIIISLFSMVNHGDTESFSERLSTCFTQYIMANH